MMTRRIAGLLTVTALALAPAAAQTPPGSIILRDGTGTSHGDFNITQPGAWTLPGINEITGPSWAGTNPWTGFNTFSGHVSSAITASGDTMIVSSNGATPESIVGYGVAYTAGSFVMETPIGSSITNAVAVGAYLVNNAVQTGAGMTGGGNSVGVYSNVTGASNYSATWAYNGVNNNSPGGINSNLIGFEQDINNTQSTSIGNAFEATGASTSSGAGYAAYAVQLMDQQNAGAVGSGGYINPVKWAEGFYEQDGSVNIAAWFAASQGKGANVQGAPLLFSYYDGSATGQNYTMQATGFGMIFAGTAGSTNIIITGAYELSASAGNFDTYISNVGHAGTICGGINITSCTIGNNSETLILNSATLDIAVPSTGAICINTFSIPIEINGVAHNINICS